MSLGGVAWQGQTGGIQTFLRLPSTPQSRQSRDSSPYTGEPRSGTHRQKDSPFSTRVDCVCRAAQGSREREQIRTTTKPSQ